MNAALCEKVGGGAFPTAAQVAALDPAELQAKCGLGYRSKSIAKLALQVPSSSQCIPLSCSCVWHFWAKLWSEVTCSSYN